jgi:8-oxo-dGTP pyrophosphatase MutT (NUDIX family)
MVGYLKPWARGFLIDQGWVRVANFLNFQVRDSTNVSRHALDSAVDLIIDCVVKTGIDPETTVVRVSDRDVRLLHKVSVSEIVREWGGRKAEDRLFDALMARIASRVAARYQDEGFVGDRWGSRGSGILFTHEDRMLLLKRSGAVLEPGTWGIPGGAIGIDGDGNYEDAWKSALREASEEAGGVRGSPKGKFVFRDGSFTYTTFFVEAAKEFAPRLNWESSDWAWVTREEALGMRLHPGVRKLMKSRAASGRDRDLELHLYDFDGTLFRSPLRPDWWGKRSWWVESESLGPPCVPLKPGSSWWIGSTVRAAKKSIADPNVWAILCTGRADTGSLRYRVAELLKQQGLGFDEVYLAKGGQDAPSMYKVNVMAKILSRYPNIATVQIWEDTNLSRYVRYIESTGRTCIPHPVKVAPHEVDCTEEDMARMVEEGWSKWRKQP